MRRSEKCLSEKPNHCSVEKHHFTLIELLIVVAIIAILASMLMPALNSAVKASRSISCVNLEKTLSLGFQLYAGNNNDYIPSCYYASRRYPGFSGDVATEGATWRAYIYLSVYPNSPKDNSYTWTTTYKFVCPEVIAPITHFADNSYSFTVKAQGPLGYSMRKFTFNSDGTEIPFFKMSKIKSPSKSLLIMETWNMSSHGQGFGGASDRNNGPMYRHSGNTANILMFDGHTAKTTAPQLLSWDHQYGYEIGQYSKAGGKLY